MALNVGLLFLGCDELPSPSSLSSLESITMTRPLVFLVFVTLISLSSGFYMKNKEEGNISLVGRAVIYRIRDHELNHRYSRNYTNVGSDSQMRM